MKKAKNLLLISIGVIFIGMIILYSCRSYTGPIPKIADTSSGGTDTSSGGTDTGSGGADTNSGGGGMLDNDTPYIIPAITVTKDNILIAAVGSASGGRMLIKTSKDGGTNWIKKASIDAPDFTGVIVHPFFIQGYNGEILLGVACEDSSVNKVVFYKSTTAGENWNRLSEIGANSLKNFPQNYITGVAYDFVTYGNAVALKHGANTNKLIFPYFYKSVPNDKGWCMATMLSTDNGATWQQHGKDFGDYTTNPGKFLEIENGDVLYFISRNNVSKNEEEIAWIKSTDCGKTVNSTGFKFNNLYGKSPAAGKNVDFCRYEFYGKDIGNIKSRVLVVFSDFNHTKYSVMMSTDDFNNGQIGAKFLGGAKEVGKNSDGQPIWPSITVLRDGTIATLAAENGSIFFRSFGLSFLQGTDTKTYGKKLW